MTNGDVGHFEQAGGPLARCCSRVRRVRQPARHREPGPRCSRRRAAADPREQEDRIAPDPRVAGGHRHGAPTLPLPSRLPLHGGAPANDSAVVVVAPFFLPDTPPTPRNPVFMYYSDNFQDPRPFTPTVVVGIDGAADKKWQCISAMPSQFGDRDSWQGRTLANVPAGDREREAYLLDIVKKRNLAVAEQYPRSADRAVRIGTREADPVCGGVRARTGTADSRRSRS